MKYFGNVVGQGTRVGYGILSAIKGVLMIKDTSNYIAALQNPLYWPAIAVDLTLEADLILTSYTGRVLPITTKIIGNLPFGKRVLNKLENLYDFLLDIDNKSIILSKSS